MERCSRARRRARCAPRRGRDELAAAQQRGYFSAEGLGGPLDRHPVRRPPVLGRRDGGQEARELLGGPGEVVVEVHAASGGLGAGYRPVLIMSTFDEEA